MGELYMVDARTGERTLISGTVEELAAVPAMTEVEPEPIFLTKGFNLPATATFTANVNRLTLLSIVHGHKVTNNWLKRHGGVMSRKIHRRYRRE